MQYIPRPQISNSQCFANNQQQQEKFEDSLKLSPSENNLHSESDLDTKTIDQKSVSKALSSQTAPNFLTKTENLAASIRHGLEIIDSYRHSAALGKSSLRLSSRPKDSRLVVFPVDKVDVGVQTFLNDNATKEDSVVFTCNNCKSRMQLDVNKIDNNSNMQLVPVDCAESADKPKKQVLKAVEKVLAGSIRREMALEEFCAKQTSEIMQLNHLLQQYKYERECSAIIAQTREDKVLRLESLMDGVLPTEEFMNEELVSLTHEHKLLKENHEHHPEVMKMETELKRVQDELQEYLNFYKSGESEVFDGRDMQSKKSASLLYRLIIHIWKSIMIGLDDPFRDEIFTQNVNFFVKSDRYAIFRLNDLFWNELFTQNVDFFEKSGWYA